MMRAFVAVEMAAPLRLELAGAMQQLQRLAAPIKWVAPENIHLTLKFLGKVEDERVPEAIEIMKQCAEGIGPFELELKGAGAFPNLNRPRVLFVKAEDRPPVMAELARRLDRRMTRAGVPKEDRPFRSHVTIGRVRRPRPMPQVGENLASLAERNFGMMIVNRIVLIQSKLTPSGPVYTPVEHVPLTDDR